MNFMGFTTLRPDHEYLRRLDKMAERAREHNLHFWTCWTDDFCGLLVEDCNTPRLTDEYGFPLIGEGFVEFDEDDLEELLDRLDGIVRTDDDDDTAPF